MSREPNFLNDPNIPPPEWAYRERLDEEAYLPAPRVCHLAEQWKRSERHVLETIGLTVQMRNKRLRTYAFLFGLDPDAYDLIDYPKGERFKGNEDYFPEKMIEAIREAAPCEWIEACEEFLETSPLGKYLYLYGTDYMIDIYTWIREGRITQNIENLIGRMNEAIYAAPRTNEQFMVFRISRYSIPAGDSVIFETPKSGTFLMNVLEENYLQGGDSTIFRVWIPRNSVLTYVPLYDQVVFPTGAELLAVNDPEEETLYIEGEERTFQIQDVYYVSAPEEPLILLDSLTFEKNSDETFDDVIVQWKYDDPFPFVESNV